MHACVYERDGEREGWTDLVGVDVRLGPKYTVIPGVSEHVL